MYEKDSGGGMKKRFKVVTDACCHVPEAHKKGRMGRGFCACGVVIIDKEGNTAHETGKYLGEMTVPESEYQAIITGLEEATSFSREEIEVWSDNQLAIKQLNKEWKLNADNLKPLYDRVITLCGRYKGVKFFFHKREAPLARAADKVANKYYKLEGPEQ